MARRRSASPVKDRTDLVHNSEVAQLVSELVEICMAVLARYLLGELAAVVDKQVHEVIIGIAPVYVTEVEYSGDRAVFDQDMILREIGMKNHGLEAEIRRCAAI